MRAEIHGLEFDDFGDEIASLTASIGEAGGRGADLFHIQVATPRGISNRHERRPFVGLVVERFEPAAIERVIRDFVASVEGPTWDVVAGRLGRMMHWEFAAFRG